MVWIEALEIDDHIVRRGRDGLYELFSQSEAGRYLLVLRSARPREGEITIVANTPDGGSYAMVSTPARFNGIPPTYRVNIQAKVTFTLPGQYWFDVMFGGRLLTRAPLEVSYVPPEVSMQRPP